MAIKAPKSVIKAEGAAHKADVEKAKPKPKPEKTETAAFPAAAKINDYGFLHFKNAWLENLGWTKGMALKVDKNADGSVTLRKA